MLCIANLAWNCSRSSLKGAGVVEYGIRNWVSPGRWRTLSRWSLRGLCDGVIMSEYSLGPLKGVHERLCTKSTRNSTMLVISLVFNVKVNYSFFWRLSWELPGLVTDVQKALLESSSRLNMLLDCLFWVLRRAHEVEWEQSYDALKFGPKDMKPSEWNR